MIKEPRFQNCSKQTHRQNPGERAAIPLATELPGRVLAPLAPGTAPSASPPHAHLQGGQRSLSLMISLLGGRNLSTGSVVMANNPTCGQTMWNHELGKALGSINHPETRRTPGAARPPQWAGRKQVLWGSPDSGPSGERRHSKSASAHTKVVCRSNLI